MDIKKLSVAGCAAILALTLDACGNTSASNDESHSTDHASAAKAAGEKFTIGFDPNFPPYGYKDEKTGECVSFDIDLAKEVAKRDEWKFVPQPIDWDAKDMELNSGTVDYLWNGLTTNGREDRYTWSKPYVDNSIMFITKTADRITDIEGFAGKHVLVQTDSSGLTALENKDNKDLKDSFASLDQVLDYNQTFMNMESGAADAVAVDVGVANFQVQAREKGKFTIIDPPFHTEQYGIGFKKGNGSLRNQVQKALDEMKVDGAFVKLAEKRVVEKSVIKDQRKTEAQYE